MSQTLLENQINITTSQVRTTTSRGYEFQEEGPENTAMGMKHPFARPEFDDPYEERQWVKNHMAAAFRIFARKGFTEGTAGHISVRDPVDKHTFWINPLGVHFDLIKASDLVRVNYDGDIIDGKETAINRAGFSIHSALHKARSDVNAACHCHTIYGKAYAAFGKPLEMINQDVCTFYKAHGVYADFGGVALDGKEGEAIANAVGTGRGAILSNHGLITVGQTVDEAAYLLTLMEKSCQIQMEVDIYEKITGCKKLLIGDEEALYTKHMQADSGTLYTEFQPDYCAEIKYSNGDFLN